MRRDIDRDHPSLVLSLTLAALLATATPALAGATVTIVNGNGPGFGLNDNTPVAPVGGNPGTTLGEQRLIALQFAAEIWASTLDSNVEIRILSTFELLSCTSTSAVLGSAGPTNIVANYQTDTTPPFPGPEFPNTWYASVLGDKRSGTELLPGISDLRARANVNLGQPGCFSGIPFYLGLDNNPPASSVDLVTVMLHEFAHGLGFTQFGDLVTGQLPNGLPDVYNRNLLDTSLGISWDMMSNPQRQASAVNTRRVVWEGNTVTDAIPSLLDPGTPLLVVNSPGSIAGDYSVGEALFGPPLSSAPVTGALVEALDPSNLAGPSDTDACSPLTNPGAVAGNVALVDRGSCNFTVKAANVQAAGAIGLVVVDNVAGGPPPGMGGTDPTIVIPSVRIMLADGNTIKAQLGAGVNVSLLNDPLVLLGADRLGRALMNTQNPVAPGSSISHWDFLITPNQLMEPAFSPDLTHQVDDVDLTTALMRDIGWFADADVDGLENDLDGDDDNDGVADGSDCAPLDATAFAVPAEVAGLMFDADKDVLRWTSAAPGAGSATVHDVLRGALDELPVGSGAAESCVDPGVGGNTATDTFTPLSGQGVWYQVRGRNPCGDGPYGFTSGNDPRNSTTCP